MTAPIISIIVPCYNQAQYLPETLQSVLNQNYYNWECIIVNDGSPDNTKEVALEWCSKDPRFKYLEKENGGLSSARNFGINHAKGGWILPLDSDDIINVDYLKLAVYAINNDPMLDLIYCKAENFDEVVGPFILEEYSFRNLLCTNMIFCSAFFRKEAWSKAKGYDILIKKGREDWEFWVNILDEKSNVLCLDYLGFYYRRKKKSMDVLFNQDRKFLVEVEKYVYEKHKDKYLKQFGTPQDSLLKIKILEKRLLDKNDYQHKIYKNIITRVLYKIIKIIV